MIYCIYSLLPCVAFYEKLTLFLFFFPYFIVIFTCLFTGLRNLADKLYPCLACQGKVLRDEGNKLGEIWPAARATVF
jgi:hypothetical protein